MVTLTLFILFFGFYVCYNTSHKIDLVSNFGFEPLVESYGIKSKLVGFILLLLSLVLFISQFGLGAGSLFFFIAFMTIGSLIFLLYPLGWITYKTLMVALAVTAFLEFLNL